MSDEPLKIDVDLNVLNHLGIGLYSNTPAVLTEIVANAWDADATEVAIQLDANEIRIRDDGHGMDRNDLQRKFLTVGYPRRQKGEQFTKKGAPPVGRQCMGRKGIGKLAMFSLADEIHLVSKPSGGGAEGFVVTVPALKAAIEAGKTYFPEPITNFTGYEVGENGTLIVLRQLRKGINRTEQYLRRRIARRFSVISGSEGFAVVVNDRQVTLADRGFYGDIQLLWTFGNAEKVVAPLCNNMQRHHHFDGLTLSGHAVNGFIGGVFKPEMLKKDDDNNNTITLLANGRIFDEDVQKRIDDSRVFNSYLVGELQYDFLDVNDQEDIAVSSRQGVQENDPRFQEFLGYVRSRLAQIAGMWDIWRRELGAAQVATEFPVVDQWLQTLTPKHRERAKQLMNKVNVIRFTGNEAEQKAQRREVIKSQILAFEKLRLQDNIEAIQSIDVEQNIADFRDVMITVEDLEASLHRDIVEQRLAVIRKLDDDQGAKVKEVVVQEHIYNHLWLVDSRWEHKAHETDWEKTLTHHLKAACPDSEEGARLDIGYRTTAGRYIVIELKKPGLKVPAYKLLDQGEKYVMALEDYFDKNPDSSPIAGSRPPIDVVFIVDSCPQMNDIYENRLRGINGRITTYKDLILQARIAYEDYMKASAKVGRIRDILDAL